MFRPKNGFTITNYGETEFSVTAPSCENWKRAARFPWLKGYIKDDGTWVFPKERRELVLQALDNAFGSDYLQQWLNWKTKWEEKNGKKLSPPKTSPRPSKKAKKNSSPLSKVTKPTESESISEGNVEAETVPPLPTDWKESMRKAYARYQKTNTRIATED